MEFITALTIDETRTLQLDFTIDETKIASAIEKNEWLGDVLDVKSIYRVSDSGLDVFFDRESIDVDDFAIASVDIGLTMAVLIQMNDGAVHDGVLTVTPMTVTVPVNLDTGEIVQGATQLAVAGDTSIKVTFSDESKAEIAKVDSDQMSKLLNQSVKVKVTING